MSLCKGQTWDVQLLVRCAVLCCAGGADAYALTSRKRKRMGRPGSQDDVEQMLCAVLLCCVWYCRRIYQR